MNRKQRRIAKVYDNHVQAILKKYPTPVDGAFGVVDRRCALCLKATDTYVKIGPDGKLYHPECVVEPVVNG